MGVKLEILRREIFPPDNPERRRAMAELKQRLRERKVTQD